MRAQRRGVIAAVLVGLMLAGCSDEVPVGEYTVCVSKDGDTITIEIKSSPGSQPVTGGTIYQYDAQGNAVGETEFSGDSTSVDSKRPGVSAGVPLRIRGEGAQTLGAQRAPASGKTGRQRARLAPKRSFQRAGTSSSMRLEGCVQTRTKTSRR